MTARVARRFELGDETLEATRLLIQWRSRRDSNDCWIWQGYLNKKSGYAQTSVAGWGNCYIHRLSYEVFRGPIPEGLQVDHLCRVRACVNPAHLEPVTASENNRRALRLLTPEQRRARGRRIAEFNLTRDYDSIRAPAACPSCGNERERWGSSGQWRCRPCRAAKERARRLTLRERVT